MDSFYHPTSSIIYVNKKRKKLVKRLLEELSIGRRAGRWGY
jgi:hypothetical protein